MSIVSQLYQLQQIDLEIESNEKDLNQKSSQLGESPQVIATKNSLASEQQRLDELKQQQHSAEWEIDDLTGKITSAEEQLYDGKITNPKELSSLQQEVNMLKAKQDKLETRALEIIDQVEQAESGTDAIKGEVDKLAEEWQVQQGQLSAEIEELKSKISDLQQKRQSLAAEIDRQVLELYEGIRKQKGQAIARVEQGICRSCRISLPVSELQQARGGNLVQCGSCGRILFLP